jgi:hypothetical protein
MSQGASIRISRSQKRWWFGVQAFRIELDGAIVAKLYGGESRVIGVDPGEHVLRAKFRYVVWSDRLRVSVDEGEERVVSCQTDRLGYPSIQEG